MTLFVFVSFNKTRANTGKGLTGADLVSRLKMLKVIFRGISFHTDNKTITSGLSVSLSLVIYLIQNSKILNV